MDKKIAGLLGAAAAIATVTGANATGMQAPSTNPAASYRDLLNPVPNALAALKAEDAQRGDNPAGVEQLAQVSVTVGHHHHHHHHHVARPHVRIVPRHHHHHHHHHHSSVYIR